MKGSKPEYYCDFGHTLQKGVAEVWFCACFGGFFVRYKFAKTGWGNRKVTLLGLQTGFKPLTEQQCQIMLRAQIRHLIKVQVDEYKRPIVYAPLPRLPFENEDIPF